MQPKPGDIGLCHSYGWLPTMIRGMERLRYRKKKGTEAYWSHAFMLVEPMPDNPGDWLIVEAEADGVQYNYLSLMGDYEILNSKLDDRGRELAVAYASLTVGSHYGFLTIASIAVNLLTPVGVQLNRPGTFICSGLVATALEHGGWTCPLKWEAGGLMPADLAFLFGGHLSAWYTTRRERES